MKYEDLSFNFVNKDGINVICDITEVIPNPDNNEEPFVKFTDYTLDEDNEFVVMYGKIIDEGEEAKLELITDENLIKKIDELSQDETVKYVNEQIQENISE